MNIVSYLINSDKQLTNHKMIVYELENGHVEYSNFLTQSYAKTLYDNLSKLNYQQSEFLLYGKTVLTPRLQFIMSDPNWTPDILMLKNKLGALTNFKFNYVLINYYRDGNDYIAYHSDSEAIGEGKNVICSLSLGADRQFVMKNAKTKKSFTLQNGSLLIMKGDDTQKYWKHSITKSKKIKEPRINLTFRHS